MTQLQPIAVLGGGSFGTALANLLAENGQRVLQCMRDPEQAEQMRQSGENPRYLKGVKLHCGIEPTSDLSGVLQQAELVLVALPSNALRDALQPVAAQLGVDPVHFGIMMIVNLEIGYLTPPMGLNLIVAMGAFQASFGEVCRAALPFIGLMLLGLIIVALVPGLTLFAL